MVRKWIFILSLALVQGSQVAPCHAQQNLPEELRRRGRETLRAIEPLRAILQKSSAVIYDGRRPATYGVVVSSDGYILTKASELAKIKELKVRVDKQLFPKAELLGKDALWDVALLKIPATALEPVTYCREEPPQGTVVVSNAATSSYKRRAQWGVISANSRALTEKEKASLGFRIDETAKGIVVKKVPKKSNAHRAGIQRDDLLIEIDGKSTQTAEMLEEVMESYEPKDTVTVLLERKGKQIEVKLELQKYTTRNDQMSGLVSERRTDFPRVIQHDSTMMARTIGGPLLMLDGKCVGMNIAKANRSETFAIPAANLIELTTSLMSTPTSEQVEDSSAKPGEASP